MPERIQRKRTMGFRMPENTVSVVRPGRFGNPCRVGMFKNYSAADAKADFRRWIERDPAVASFNVAFGDPPTCEEIRDALRGKNLACFCRPGAPCHADVLLEVANA